MGVEEKTKEFHFRELGDFYVDHLDEVFEFKGVYSAIELSPKSFTPPLETVYCDRYDTDIQARQTPATHILKLHRNTTGDKDKGELEQKRVGLCNALNEAEKNHLYNSDYDEMAERVILYFRKDVGGWEFVIEGNLEFPEAKRKGLRSAAAIYNACNGKDDKFCGLAGLGEGDEPENQIGNMGLIMMLGAFDEVELYKSPYGGTITRLYLRTDEQQYSLNQIHYILGELRNDFACLPNAKIGELTSDIESE